MPHLDEGLLHTYLDGALSREADKAAEAFESRQDVERHLNECAECRTALEDARQLREESARILSAAGPGRVSMPSFEELQARAESASSTLKQQADTGVESQRRRLLRMRSLAWAATVVLAATVGWYARTAVLTSTPDQSVSESETDAQLTIQIPQTHDLATAGDSEQQAPRRSRAAVEEEGLLGAEAEEGAVRALGERTATIEAVQPPSNPPADTVAVRRTVVAERSDALGPPKGASDTVSMPDIVRVDSGDRVAATVNQPKDRDRMESPQPRQVSVVSSAPTMAQVTGGRGGGDESEWTNVDKASAEAILQQSVPRIEGLTVLGYAALVAAEGRVVRILQALDSGNVVELLVMRGISEDLSTADKKRVEPTDGLNSLVVVRDNLSIRLSAPVTTDSLRALGQQIVSR
jgi:hypothetical protein